MSSDNEFEDPYNISSEEAVGPLEVENTDIIQAEMPSGNENKSICKSLTTHLNLLKGRVNELSSYLDDREAVLIKPPEAKKGPRGRRRWWYVRGERVCRRSAGGGGMFEVNVSAGGLLEQGLPEAL